MNSTTEASSLTTPLIGDEVDLESAPIASPERSQKEDADDATDMEETVCDRLLTVLFTVLLLTQFWGSVFLFDGLTSARLEWSEVCTSTIFFGFTSYLFQRTLRDEKINSIGLHMLPDFVTAAACAMICFQNVALAFLTMVVTMLVMAVFIILASIHLLVTGASGDDEEEKETENKDYEIMVV